MREFDDSFAPCCLLLRGATPALPPPPNQIRTRCGVEELTLRTIVCSNPLSAGRRSKILRELALRSARTIRGGLRHCLALGRTHWHGAWSSIFEAWLPYLACPLQLKALKVTSEFPSFKFQAYPSYIDALQRGSAEAQVRCQQQRL